MKKNLFIVINNMMTRYKLTDFMKTTYNPLLKIQKSNYHFDVTIVIVDDSGNLSKDEIQNYYGKLMNAIVIINPSNLNLLASRFKILDYLGSRYDLSNTWIRFIDSGDTPINSGQFLSEFDSVVKSDADWVIFPQIMGNTNKYYFSCLGDTTDKSKIISSVLMNHLCSTTWTKVFRADLLKKVHDDICEFSSDMIPNLFHTEDYLISVIYSKYVSNLVSMNIPFIKYDSESGESRSRVVDKCYFDKVMNDINKVYDIIDNVFLRNDIIDIEDIRLMMDFKLNPYINRFKLK